MPVRVDDIFEIKSGDYHALAELDPGDTPLISCGDVNHGYHGLFDIPPENRYSAAITVAYNGQPLTAKFRPYEFGAKDDVGVLLPRQPLQQLTLVYIAGLFNSMRWRFSYGRKCYREKLISLEVDLPSVREHGVVRVDEGRIAEVLPHTSLDLRPKVVTQQHRIPSILEWETKCLSDLFELRRGDFHSLQVLDEGNVPTVSRTELDNGVVGHFGQPENVPLNEIGLITVSTVSGHAFVQMADFMATDNVIILVPSVPMRISTVYFVAAMINKQKWRYSYGRQCYTEKLANLAIDVPWKSGTMDETAIERVVTSQTYWPYVQAQLRESMPQVKPHQQTLFS